MTMTVPVPSSAGVMRVSSASHHTHEQWPPPPRYAPRYSSPASLPGRPPPARSTVVRKLQHMRDWLMGTEESLERQEEDWNEVPWCARCLVVIGGCLGHVPFSRPWSTHPPTFTWYSVKALYSVTLDAILTTVAVIELVDLLRSSVDARMSKWIVDVFPEVVLQVAHVSLVLVSLPAAPILATLLRSINELHHPCTTFASVVILLLWTFNAVATVVKTMLCFRAKGDSVFSSFKSFVYFISDIYSRVYMTWPVAFVMVVCLSVCSSLRNSRELVRELAESSIGGKLSCYHIEEARLWYRRLVKYNAILIEIASPVLLIAAMEVVCTFPLHLYKYITHTLMAGWHKVSDPLAVTELLYFASEAMLVVALPCVTDTIVEEYELMKRVLIKFHVREALRDTVDELAVFRAQLQIHDAEYTANGFFTVSRASLLKLMSAVSLNMMIAVAFYVAAHATGDFINDFPDATTNSGEDATQTLPPYL